LTRRTPASEAQVPLAARRRGWDPADRRAGQHWPPHPRSRVSVPSLRRLASHKSWAAMSDRLSVQGADLVSGHTNGRNGRASAKQSFAPQRREIEDRAGAVIRQLDAPRPHRKLGADWSSGRSSSRSRWSARSSGRGRQR